MFFGNQKIRRRRSRSVLTAKMKRLWLKRSAVTTAALFCFFVGAHKALAIPDRSSVVSELCTNDAHEIGLASDQLLATLPLGTSDDIVWASHIAFALANRTLLCASNGQGYIEVSNGTLDAATLKPVDHAPVDASAPFPSLHTRILIERLKASITLISTLPADQKLAAIKTLTNHNDALPSSFIQLAISRSQDVSLNQALHRFSVIQGLHAIDPAERIAAIRDLAHDTTSETLGQLNSLQADPTYDRNSSVAEALTKAISHITFWVATGKILALLYNALSAGSILFMSAIGLAVIFGLMGVINLAQGELIMIGAYTTYCVQNVLKVVAPDYISLYPIIAIPIVFVITALIGIIIEVAVIRHLYRRPLMTLLATWGISILLINLVRVSFGPQNLDFITPAYLTGGIPVVGDFFITWNHLAAILFAVFSFFGAMALLRFTSLGLFIRGVTQNRDMAGCVGVSARRIDMLAFGFGAGLAGLAGLAMAPIYNVNPSMGTNFIIDSFMVVVLGGVGSIVGTAIAAFGIGLVNVGIEPFYGAVGAKVIALILIVAIIQWRPQGLIAIKGRR